MDDGIDGIGTDWTCDKGDNLWRLDLHNPSKKNVTAQIYLDDRPAHSVVVPAKGEAKWVYRVIDGTPDVDRTYVAVMADQRFVTSMTATDNCVAAIPLASVSTPSSDPSGMLLMGALVLACAFGGIKVLRSARRHHAHPQSA